MGQKDRQVQYDYLPGGLIASVWAPFLHAAATTYLYDNAGRLLTATLPNGTIASSSYDAAGRLTLVENKTASGTVISRHAYTLDGAGNRTAADEDNGPTLDGISTYTYDNLNRLTEAVHPDNQQAGYRRVTYAYNDGGDRTSLEQWTGTSGSWTQYGSTVGYTMDTAGRMTAAGGVNYCYDNNGNQTRRGGSDCNTGGDTFTFNAENRMTQAVISGATSNYTYDGKGVRTRKITAGVTTDYFQDVNGDLPRVAAEKVGSAWTYYVYGQSLVARLGSDGAVQYYHYDGSGNVRAITNASGAVIERYDYDAFGALRNTPGSVTNDRRFSGEQWDGETGNVFLRARYYDPALGRFIGADPIRGEAVSPQTLNRYAYALNNPGSRVDPSGLLSIKCTPGSSSCDSPAIADIPGITSSGGSRRSRDRGRGLGEQSAPTSGIGSAGRASSVAPAPTGCVRYTHGWSPNAGTAAANSLLVCYGEVLEKGAMMWLVTCSFGGPIYCGGAWPAREDDPATPDAECSSRGSDMLWCPQGQPFFTVGGLTRGYYSIYTDWWMVTPRGRSSMSGYTVPFWVD